MSEEQNTQETTDSAPRENPVQDERTVPYHRFKEINDSKRDLEKRLKALENERQTQEESRAQAQGEYQELAEKRQNKVQKLEEELKQTRSEWARERRMRMFNRAASGVIIEDGLEDAFSFLTEDELSGVDENDEGGFRMLAQNLAERKPYLAAGPVGSGSGGSHRPVFDITRGNGGASTPKTGARPFQFKKTQKHWK